MEVWYIQERRGYAPLLLCSFLSTAHESTNFQEGLHNHSTNMEKDKFDRGIKKVRGTTPSPKSNQNNPNYVRIILMLQRYKLFQIIKYFSDCFISVLPHYCDIIEDWSIFFHGLTYTVFQRTKRDSKVVTMLDERFAS